MPARTSRPFRNLKSGLRRRSLPSQVRCPRQNVLAHRAVCLATAANQAKSRTAKGFEVAIDTEPQPKSHLQLTVTLPAHAVKEYYDATVEHFKKTTNLPGFRKGAKAPTDVLFRMLDGGAERVKETAIENLLQVALPKALERYDKVVITESIRVETGRDELLKEFDTAKPLVFKIGIDLAPEVSWNSSYKDINVEVEAAGDDASDKAAVNRMLHSLRKENGTLRVVTDRGLQMGDVVIVDFDAARADDDGEPIVGARQPKMRFDTELSDREFIPGLVDGMLGMKVGEERVVEVTLPDTWQPQSLQGVRTKCTVKAQELFEWKLPEVDDAFIQKNIPACSSVSQAEAQLFEAQQQKTLEATERRLVEALSDAVANAVQADIPESLLIQMGESEYQAHLLQLQSEGKLDMSVIQQLANEKMLMNFIEKHREDLYLRQKAVLGFEDIYRAEGLAVSEEEVKREYAEAAENFQKQGQEFDRDRLAEQVAETLKATKSVQWLRENCAVTIKSYSGRA